MEVPLVRRRRRFARPRGNLHRAQYPGSSHKVNEDEARRYVNGRGISESVMRAAGLRVGSGVMARRLVFPWLDRDGIEVYVTGRSLNGQEPRYRHSKGERPALYASPGAWESDRVGLVEGQVDALVCAEAGLSAFATSGASAFSDEAAAILAAKQEVIVCADNDEAGAKWRAKVVEALAGRTALLEARLPDDVSDIAEIAERAQKQGDDPAEAVAELLAEAVPVETRSNRRAVDGATFILDAPPDVPTIWGDGQSVLWAQGETFLIVGPSGIGKTTLGQQLALCRIGLAQTLLGVPVATADKPLLYVAADRPSQAARSFARMVGEKHRAVLTERLVVWRGPLPFDIASEPERFVEFVAEYGAGTVVLDSLKDVALDLTTDETGSRLNHALQLTTAEGIEVLALHHQRKQSAGNTKPKALADVYGSTWITAGAGSVLLLWGDAGDIVVSAEHLKQPAAEVGPFKVRHEHDAGRTEIFEPTDLFGLIKSARSGLTAVDAARVLFSVADPSPNQREKARRRLDDLVRRKMAHCRAGLAGGKDGGKPATYHAASLLEGP